VVRNSRFLRCSDHDIFIRSWGRTAGDKLANFTIENNFFGKTTRGFYAGQYSRPAGSGGTCDNMVLRNNVLEQSWTFRCTPASEAPEAPKVSGNYWAFSGVPSACGQGEWRLNVYEKAPGPTCDPTRKVVRGDRAMAQLRDEALRRIKAIGFRCGAPIEGTGQTVTVCGLGGKRYAYRLTVVSDADERTKLVVATALRRNGTIDDALKLLGPLSASAFKDDKKAGLRASRFVARWLGKSADGRFGSLRLRVYTDEDTLSLLISPA
jgi:hypothetical protein